MYAPEHILTSTEYKRKQEKQQKSYGEQTTIRKRNTNKRNTKDIRITYSN